jgi:hypothetical protein
VSIALLAVCGLSYICSIMVIEAMAAMPGNAKFDKRVECQSPALSLSAERAAAAARYPHVLAREYSLLYCPPRAHFVTYRAACFARSLCFFLCRHLAGILLFGPSVVLANCLLFAFACCPVAPTSLVLELLTVHFHRRCLSASFVFVSGYGYGVTQVFFQLSLACNNISSIIQSVQVMDFAIADIFGRSCSVPEFSPEFKFYCPEAIDGQQHHRNTPEPIHVGEGSA